MTCFHEISEYESTNFDYQILCNICFDFFKSPKLRKNCLFLTNKGICFLFHLRNIGERVCRFVFEKFVKTCNELNISPASPENLPNIDEFEPYEPDERNLMYAFKEPTLPDTSLIGGRLLLAAWEEGLGTIHILRKHLYTTPLPKL